MQNKMYSGPVSIGKPRLKFWETLGIVCVAGAVFVALYGMATIIAFYCMGVLCVN